MSKYHNNPVEWASHRCAEVCRVLNVAYSDFCGKVRHPLIVEAREVAYLACYDYQGPGGGTISYPEIAASTGRSNHSSIITATKRARRNPVRLLQVQSVAYQLGLKLNGAPILELSIIPAREDAKPNHTAHVLRCARRLIDQIADGTVVSIREARHIAEALLDKYPTDEECQAVAVDVHRARAKVGAVA